MCITFKDSALTARWPHFLLAIIPKS